MKDFRKHKALDNVAYIANGVMKYALPTNA